MSSPTLAYRLSPVQNLRERDLRGATQVQTSSQQLLAQEKKSTMPVDAHTYLGWERNSEVSPLTGLPDHKESIQFSYDQRGWVENWPTEACCPGFRQVSLDFMNRCHDLCLFILSCFAEGLGLPLNTFDKVGRASPSFALEAAGQLHTIWQSSSMNQSTSWALAVSINHSKPSVVLFRWPDL